MRARRICRDAVNNPVAAAKYSRSAEKLSKSRTPVEFNPSGRTQSREFAGR